MADPEREVGGLRCREVLARLSEYLDDELAPAERAAVEGHVRGCDWCERFGGQFGATIGALRQELASPPPLAAVVAERLSEGLRARRLDRR